MLKVTNLNVFFKDKNIQKYLLNDISFSINRGDCLGIIAKSGEGKSTLAKALLKIYDSNIYLESGTILFNNEEVNENMRGKKIFLIFQNPNSYLNPLMKVGKQIDEMLIYHHKENKKIAKQKAISLMEELGVDKAKEVYNYYPHEISGGMQQRICLAIALIANPEMIILDESISYLDKQSKAEIIKLIKALQNKYKFTLIIISHDFEEIYYLCNKIAVMRNGQLIEFGSKDEIITNPIHPYTLELLCDYLRFYLNIPQFSCPLMEIELLKVAPITYLTSTHFVRSWYLDNRAIEINYPFEIDKIKELIYETIRNK